MAYAYCRSCNAALAEPTDEQVILGQYLCGQCNAENDPRKTTEEVLLSMLHRIDQLEQGNLNTVVLAKTVELSLLPQEALWLRGLLQNPVGNMPLEDERLEDSDYRVGIFHKLTHSMQ